MNIIISVEDEEIYPTYGWFAMIEFFIPKYRKEIIALYENIYS